MVFWERRGVPSAWPYNRSEAINRKMEELAEFMLIHHIFKKSHDLERVAKPGWLKFGFPLMYQADALEILEILIDLGYKDERMQDAVDRVRSKQNVEKRWILENTYNGRMLYNVEVKGLTPNGLRCWQ